jgi:hypothetical protein
MTRVAFVGAGSVEFTRKRGQPRVLYANVRNRDLLPGLGEDSCVEVPCLVDATTMLDPNASATLTLDEIDALCDDLAAAHGELMPASLRREVIPA